MLPSLDVKVKKKEKSKYPGSPKLSFNPDGPWILDQIGGPT